jgi:glyoxylase-like metal-dependent hydrolase (beta-lactamase superfamily II)
VTPHGFLRAAKEGGANATLESRTVKGVKYDVVTVNTAAGGKLVGYIDDKHVLQRVETWIDNAVLGDTLYESVYSDYRAVDGIKFPYKIVQAQGGYPVYDLNVRDVKVNPELTFTPPAPPNAPAATSDKLGDGVYLISGGYSVIAIDFDDHITLLESGQNDARAAAVIAEAKRIIPGKPIKSVVNTHPHFDHSGGLRAFVAEDITIVTHETNKKYLEKVLAQPRAAGPQPNGRRPKIEGVGDKTVLTDGKRRVELYRLKAFGHHDGMLVAYLPKERVLFQADAYNPQAADAVPPTPANPFNASLLANIERLKLDVERIVPVHAPSDNRIVTLAELQRWVKGEKLAGR